MVKKIDKYILLKSIQFIPYLYTFFLVTFIYRNNIKLSKDQFKKKK